MELIVTALAAGAGVGLKDTATVAVRDAYTGLKDLLRHRIGDSEDIDADEVEPDRWHARIGQELIDSGAAGDEEVIAAARNLLVLADPAAAATLNIKVDYNYGAVGNFTAPVSFQQPPSPPTSPEVR